MTHLVESFGKNTTPDDSTGIQVHSDSQIFMETGGVLSFERRLLSLLPSDQFVTSSVKKFLELFGAKSLGGFSRIFISGIERPIDPLISEELLRLILSRRGTQPLLNILEVGAGTTYGTNANFGSPWLARSLRAVLPSNSEVVVSDQKSKGSIDVNRRERHILFYLDGKFELHSVPFEVILRAGTSALTSPLSLYEGNKQKLLPISVEELRNNSGHHLLEPSSIVDYMERQYGHGGSFFIRPELDSEIELFLFGTTFTPNVDFYRIAETLPAQEFDFIFARHLAPLPHQRTESLERVTSLADSVAKVLKTDSIAILHFDHPGDGEGDIIRVQSIRSDFDSINKKHLLQWTRHGELLKFELKK